MVFAIVRQSWLNVARLLGKVHAWSTRVSLFNPIIVRSKQRCYEFSTLPGYAFGVHVVFVCRAECFTGGHTCENIVKCTPGSCVGGNNKKEVSLNGTSSRWTEIKRTCVTFFLLWPRMVAIEQFEIMWVYFYVRINIAIVGCDEWNEFHKYL